MRPIFRLYRMLWRYKPTVLATVLCGFLAALFNTMLFGFLVPFFNTMFERPGGQQAVPMLPESMGWLENAMRRVVPPPEVEPKRTLIAVAGLMLVVICLLEVSRFLQEYLAGRIVNFVPRDLSNSLYDRISGLSMDFHTTHSIGETTSRFSADMDNIQRGLYTLFTKVIREPLTLIGLLFLMLSISWRLSLLTFCVFPVIVWFIRYFGKRVKVSTRKALAGRGELLRRINETLRGIRIVKAFCAEGAERQRVRHINERLTKQMLKITVADAGTSAVSHLLTGVALFAMILVGGVMVIDGVLAAGAFLTFYAALGKAQHSVGTLGSVNNRIQSMTAAAERVFEYLDIEPTVREKPGAEALPVLADAIRFENVSFAYNAEADASKAVLKGIDLEIKKGQAMAIVGRTGSGKSTLVGLLPRFYDVTDGRIAIDGRDIRDSSFASLRAQIGLVSQESILFCDTFANNIAYGCPGATREQIIDAARRAYAEEFILQADEGYDALVEESGRNLSGGQQQRLCLARAICKDPGILILDEATSALDTHSEALIQKALEAFMRGRTSFVIAHRLSTVEGADKIVVLDEGRIAGQGTHAELLDTCDLYRRLYQRQFAEG